MDTNQVPLITDSFIHSFINSLILVNSLLWSGLGANTIDTISVVKKLVQPSQFQHFFNLFKTFCTLYNIKPLPLCIGLHHGAEVHLHALDLSFFLLNALSGEKNMVVIQHEPVLCSMDVILLIPCTQPSSGSP